jgi:hypothetical protein
MVGAPVSQPLPSGLPGAGRMCGAFVDALMVTGASISVFGRDGQQSTVCASDTVSARGDTIQLELGEGPHWDALTVGLAVLAPDLGDPRELRWPVFSEAARDLGMVAVFAFPMTMGAVRVGAVDLYCDKPRRLDVHQVSLAVSMAGRAAGPAVRQAVRSAEDPRSLEDERSPALRREVHQATGMIQVQLDIDATDAFMRLRAHSFADGRPVAEVAHDVVTGRLDFSSLPD